jgi:hypothetical protein
MVDLCINKYGTDSIIEMIDQINILTLTPSIRKRLSLSDPLTLRFDKFKQLVDDLGMCVKIEDFVTCESESESHEFGSLDEELFPDQKEDFVTCESESETHEFGSLDEDLSPDQKQEIIFIHNEIPYHGNRRSALNALELTRGMDDLCCFREPITLTSELSADLMNQWIRSIDQKMNIMGIKTDDLIPLLNHINKYPTIGTNLTSIEYDVVQYLESMKSHFDPLNLIEFAESCGMKLLYMCLHNIKIEQQTMFSGAIAK